MNELPDEETRAKKAVRGQEYTYKAVLGSLRRVCADPHIPRGARFDAQTLPQCGYAMYMIYMSWLRQKTELEKLLMVPNTVRGRPGRHKICMRFVCINVPDDDIGYLHFLHFYCP